MSPEILDAITNLRTAIETRLAELEARVTQLEGGPVDDTGDLVAMDFFSFRAQARAVTRRQREEA